MMAPVAEDGTLTLACRRPYNTSFDLTAVPATQGWTKLVIWQHDLDRVYPSFERALSPDELRELIALLERARAIALARS